MLLQRIQADDFRGESDLAIAGLRPGINAILLPDWQSADELTQRVFNAFVGEKSDLSETVFFVSDEMGDAIMSDDDVATLLSDFDITLFESLFHDHVRPADIGPLVRDLDLTGLFAAEEQTAPASRPSTGMREQIGFRNEVLQESLLSAKREFDGSRERLQTSDRTQYADLVKKRAKLLSTVNESKDELRKLNSTVSPLKLANEISGLWRRRDKLERRSSDTRSLEKLIQTAEHVADFDSTIADLRAEISTAKRGKRQLKSTVAGADQENHAARTDKIRSLLKESDRAETAEHECEHLRRAIRDAVASNEVAQTTVQAPRMKTRQIQSPQRMIEILAPFAGQVRSARSQLHEARHQWQLRSEAPADGFLASSLSVETAAEIRELSEQVEVLNQACEQIRGRQSLPTGAIGGIIAVFLSGLALVGLGMMFELGGHDWLAIGLGVVAMISVGLLKISLERAPTLQLRILRSEILELLERITILQVEGNDKFIASLDPTVSMEVAQEKLDVALHNWRQALLAQGLPESLSPNRLVQQLRSVQSNHEIDTSTDEFDESCDDLFDNNSVFDLAISPSLFEFDADADAFELEPIATTSRNESDHLSELRSTLDIESSLLNQWRRSASMELDINDEALRDLPIASIADNLRELLARLEDSAQKASGVRAEIDETEKQLQARLKRLKRERKTCIAETGVETLVELKELIRTERKKSGTKAKVAELNSKIEQTLVSSDVGTAARELLETYEQDELAIRLAKSQSQMSATEQTLLDNQRRLSQIAQQINELIENRELDTTRLDSAVASAKIKKATQDLVSNLILQEVLESRSEPLEVASPAINGLLATASRFFRQTTPWKEAEIRFDEQSEQFFVDRVGQFSESLEVVEDDFAVQATICIQLALFDHFRSTGLALPVLLNDQWTHPTRRFAAETVDLLNECGADGHQFLAMTWNDQSADFFGQCGQPVLVVNREIEHFSREETIAG